MRDRRLRAAIIGVGGISRSVHIPAWKNIKEAEIVAVADVDAKALETAAKDHGVPHAFRDFHKAVALDEVDVVDICTPNRVHTPAVLAALAAGKYVICEKPLAVTPAEIEQMIRAARKARRILMVAQHQRFQPQSVVLKRYVDAGNLGDIYYGRAWAIRRNLIPVRPGFICKKLSGGGPCVDIGVHILDLTLWLMGFPEPKTVSGVAQRRLAGAHIMPGGWGEWDRKMCDVEDFAVGFVRFANGATMTLESSWLSHIEKREDMSCTILGTRAGVTWPDCKISTTASGVLVDATLSAPPGPVKAHEAEIRAFVDAVLNDKPSPVPAEDSLKVIKILDGIYRSQKSGKEITL